MKYPEIYDKIYTFVCCFHSLIFGKGILQGTFGICFNFGIFENGEIEAGFLILLPKIKIRHVIYLFHLHYSFLLVKYIS